MDDGSTGPGEYPPQGKGSREGAIELSNAFELLARRPRRQLLYALYRVGDQSVPLDALVQRIARDDPDDLQRMRIALHHVHLPKLENIGVVEYDPTNEEIRYLGDPRLDDLIEWARQEDTTE